MSTRARSNSTRHYVKRGHTLTYERGFRGGGRTASQKRAKHTGGQFPGGFPAQQPPGMPRGIHAVLGKGEQCRCGGCSA